MPNRKEDAAQLRKKLQELIGHLPIYGTMLALLVYGSNDRTARLVDALPSLRRTAKAVRAAA